AGGLPAGNGPSPPPCTTHQGLLHRPRPPQQPHHLYSSHLPPFLRPPPLPLPPSPHPLPPGPPSSPPIPTTPPLPYASSSPCSRRPKILPGHLSALLKTSPPPIILRPADPRPRPQDRPPRLPSLALHLSTLLQSRRPRDALNAFEEISDQDEVCYGALVVGLAQNHCAADALSVFATMRSDSAVSSTMYSVSGALRAAAHLAALEQSRIIHAHAVVAGLETNLVVSTTLVDAYGKSGIASDARKVFEGMVTDANLVMWNAMLGHMHNRATRKGNPVVQ
ncbi:unnamed protein product, partial [Musa acuminata subsp. burmannicoides]